LFTSSAQIIFLDARKVIVDDVAEVESIPTLDDAVAALVVAPDGEDDYDDVLVVVVVEEDVVAYHIPYHGK
jgi:hypothetical protein